MTITNANPNRRTVLGGALGMGMGLAGVPMLSNIARAESSRSTVPVSTHPFAFLSEGERMAGALHMPKIGAPAAAVVLCGAWTSVKEQATGLYAKALAERGFAALAFDHRFFGESGGQPRQFENPQAKVLDVRNAVTALIADARTSQLAIVAVGLCAGGGYALRAVAEDQRIAAFAGVAGAYTDSAQMQARLAAYDQLVARGQAAEKRWRETNEAEIIPAVGPEGVDVAMPFAEALDYYGNPDRGAVPSYVNGFAVQSWPAVLEWDAISAAPAVKVPTLIVHSEKAAMPDLARRVLVEVNGPAEELWLTSRNHVDFYDDPALIMPAADAIAGHFRKSIA